MKNQKLPILILVLLFGATFHDAYGQARNCPSADYDCQIAEYSKALKADPRNIEAYYDLALAFQNKGRFKEAVEIYSMYIAAPVQDRKYLADGYNNRAVSLRKLGKHEQALEDLTKAIELNPNNAEFITNRGNTYRDLRNFDLALAEYDKAIAVEPAYASAYIGRGSVNDLKGNATQALKDFSKAIRIDPKEAEAYYNRAGIHFAKRDYAKAIPDYDKYIKLNTSNIAYLADGYINRGIAHFYTGSPDSAIRDFTKAIELQPAKVSAYKARAFVYREMKKFDLAEADEKKAAELHSPQ